MSDRRHTQRPALPEGYQFGENICPVPEPIRCGHRSQMAAQFTLVTLADGTTEQERIPQKFRVRAADARFCFGCGQFVDAIDEAEALADNGWRAPHENDAAQLRRNHEHYFDRYDAAHDGLRCMCGALLDAPTVMAQRTGDETV